MKTKFLYLYCLVSILIFVNCTGKTTDAKTSSVTNKEMPVNESKDLSKYKKATFAAGCFWCEEAVFESVKGVAEVISGYSGGKEENPTYEQVGSGTTSHAESFEVYYDSTIVDYKTLLKVYFASEDPTQVNGQGPDEGTQYRSIIFYRNNAEKEAAEKYKAELEHSGKYKKPIAIQIIPFEKFWEAEAYHQDYIKHNPENPYVQHESIPRLKRTQMQVKELIKPEKWAIGK